MMPNLDGFGLADAIAERSQNDEPFRSFCFPPAPAKNPGSKGMEHGADDYLIKPFSARELLARVQTHLEMARIRKQAEEALRRASEQFRTSLEAMRRGRFLRRPRTFVSPDINPSAARSFDPPKTGSDLLGTIFWRSSFDAVGPIIMNANSFSTSVIPSNGEPIVSPVGRPCIPMPRTSGLDVRVNRSPCTEGGHGFVCYVLDITERKHAQERERQITAEAVAATAKFRAVFEQTRSSRELSPLKAG